MINACVYKILVSYVLHVRHTHATIVSVTSIMDIVSLRMSDYIPTSRIYAKEI